MESEDPLIQRHVTLSPSPLLRASLKFRQASRLDPVRSGAIFKQSAEETEQQHLEGGKREEIRTLFETLCRESPAPRALASRHKDQVRLLMPPPRAVPNQSQTALETLTDADHRKSLSREATEKGTQSGAITQSLEMGSESREQAEGSETPEKQESALDALQTSAVWEGDQMDFGHLPHDDEPPANKDVPEAERPPETSKGQMEGAEVVQVEAEIRTGGVETEKIEAEGADGLEGETEGTEQIALGQETELSALEESEGKEEGSKGVQEKDENKQRTALPKSPELTETQKKKRASKILKDLASPSLSDSLLSPYTPQGHKKEVQTGIEFTKRGRARLPPIAFWKNEGLERDRAGLPVGILTPSHKQTSPAKELKSPKTLAATHKVTPQLPRDETLCRRYDGKGWYCPSLHAPGCSMCAFHRDQAKRRALRAQSKGWHAKGRKKAKPGNTRTSEAGKKQHAGGGDVSGGDARASRKRRRETEREGDVSNEGAQPESDLETRASRNKRREIREAVKETKQDESGVSLVGHLLLAAPLVDTEVEEQMTRVLMEDPMEVDARTGNIEKDEGVGGEGNEARPKKEDSSKEGVANGLSKIGVSEELEGAKEKGEEGHVPRFQQSSLIESASKQAQDPQHEAGTARSQPAEDLLRREHNEPVQSSREMETQQQPLKAQEAAGNQGVAQKETGPIDESVAQKKLVEERIAALRAQLEAEEKKLRRLSQQGSLGLATTAQNGSALPK